MTALIDIDQLRTFIAIAETGSFTKAAEFVHKTQSAVSMQMKRLEERLDRPIFARDGRASKLTEDGERLLDYARRIVKLNVEALATFSKIELSGRVRLGVPDDYADRYLPEIMARFSRAYPGVELTVSCQSSTELMELIDDNRLDLAIVTNCDGKRPVEVFRRERLLWISSNRHSTHLEERLPLALGRWRSWRASAAPTTCCSPARTPARWRPRCCPGSRSRCFRNPACGPACACSRRRRDSRSCRPARSG
jgi:DNA-binding transcriptional LysR family regulator